MTDTLTSYGKDSPQAGYRCEKERAIDTIVVTTPMPMDVLLGRGTPFSEYRGNIKVRELIRERQAAYAKSTNREEKHKIAMDIARETSAQGERFLRCIQEGAKDIKSSKWEVLTDGREITQKIKQMIRDMSPRAIQRRRYHRNRQSVEKARARSTFTRALADESGVSPVLPNISEDSIRTDTNS